MGTFISGKDVHKGNVRDCSRAPMYFPRRDNLSMRSGTVIIQEIPCEKQCGLLCILLRCL